MKQTLATGSNKLRYIDDRALPYLVYYVVVRSVLYSLSYLGSVNLKIVLRPYGFIVRIHDTTLKLYYGH